MWVQPLGQEDPLEKEMATHSSILAWKIPWTEEPGRLQSIGQQKFRQDQAHRLNAQYGTGRTWGMKLTSRLVRRMRRRNNDFFHVIFFSTVIPVLSHVGQWCFQQFLNIYHLYSLM